MSVEEIKALTRRWFKEIDKGKNVALLEYGDPEIWGGSEYLREYIDDEMVEMVPGLSSFNVAPVSRLQTPNPRILLIKSTSPL
jgi:precorrin-2 methylase